MQPEMTKKMLSVSVILIFTLIHYTGIKYGARIQNVLTILKILLIVILLTAGFASGRATFQTSRMGEAFHRVLPDGKPWGFR